MLVSLSLHGNILYMVLYILYAWIEPRTVTAIAWPVQGVTNSITPATMDTLHFKQHFNSDCLYVDLTQKREKKIIFVKFLHGILKVLIFQVSNFPIFANVSAKSFSLSEFWNPLLQSGECPLFRVVKPWKWIPYIFPNNSRKSWPKSNFFFRGFPRAIDLWKIRGPKSHATVLLSATTPHGWFCKKWKHYVYIVHTFP